MKLPKRVKVGPHNFTVIVDPHLVGVTGKVGVTGTDTLEIRIDGAGNMGFTQVRETLLHELLHAVWTQTALDLKYNDEQEEEAVYSLSPILFGLLKDNPGLVAYLTEGE